MQPQQSPGVSDTAHIEAVPLLYASDFKNESARKAHRQKVLKERPETLFSDSYKNGDISHLIFTEQPLEWHSAIRTHYPSVKKEGICNGWKLKVREAEDPDSKHIQQWACHGADTDTTSTPTCPPADQKSESLSSEQAKNP